MTHNIKDAHNTHDSNNKTSFGFWVYLMSDCVLFAALFATFAVLRGATALGPTMHELTHLPYVTLETMLLLTSSFTVGLALLAARAAKKHLTLAALSLTLLLGLAFLGLELREFALMISEGHGPDASAFLSSYFALVGTHGLHIALGSLWMFVLMVYIAIRGLTPGNMRKLISLSLFWHFLDIVWIFIFTFVYLFGAILK